MWAIMKNRWFRKPFPILLPSKSLPDRISGCAPRFIFYKITLKARILYRDFMQKSTELRGSKEKALLHENAHVSSIPSGTAVLQKVQGQVTSTVALPYPNPFPLQRFSTNALPQTDSYNAAAVNNDSIRELYCTEVYSTIRSTLGMTFLVYVVFVLMFNGYENE